MLCSIIKHFTIKIVAVMALVEVAAHPMLWYSEVDIKKYPRIVTYRGLELDMQMATRITVTHADGHKDAVGI